MAKNRNRKRPQGGTQLFERAQRELAKGNTKTAVKDAEACFRQDSRPEHRLLLERAYLGRVEQLHRLRLPTEARAALQKLLDLKPTDPEILNRIPRLQVVVGDSRVDAAAVLEREPGLLATLADQAVLDPRSPVPPHAGIGAHVERIREAFAAVERGDDGAATEALRDLPRNSPLGDWKLFVRGLSAFYLADAERTRANWQRLDPDRPALRIAQTLLVADGQMPPEEAKADVTESLAQLRARLHTDPATGPLKELAEHWRAGDFRALFREYRRFRQRFAKSHPSLIEKIVDLLWKHAVSEGDSGILERLEAIGPAPPLDPRWNRAWAMGGDYHADPDDSELRSPWQRYIDDLAAIPTLREEERAIAVGLVYHREGTTLLESAALADWPSRGSWQNPDPDAAEKLRMLGARRLRQAIESCPRLTAAYGDLARYHEERDEPQKCAAVLHRLTGVEPNDFNAHLWLANYHLGRNKPNRSEPHVEAALRLRPRDPQCEALRWNQRLARIRALVMSRKLAEALQQVDDAAEVLDPRRTEPFTLDVIRAAIALKSGDHDAYGRHLDAALGQAGEPIAVWMAMSAAAAEYRLPRDVKKDFDNRFKAAVKAKPTGRAAGLLARLLLSMKAGKRNYSGRATQERLILKFLARTRGLEWTEADLRAVCHLLETLPKQAGLLVTLAKVGGRRFPGNAHFHYWYASGHLALYRFRSDYTGLIKHLQRAIELARAADDPADRALVPHAERALSKAYEFQRQWGHRDTWADDHDDEEDEDDDDYEDGDDYDCGDGYGRDEDRAAHSGEDRRPSGRKRRGPESRQMSLFDEEPDAIERILGQLAEEISPEALETLRRAMEDLGYDVD
ncbi:MAG: hypothetical protein RBS80_05370 [Thermoguttaceae bacterium]|jgi:hypothetical protein|nr:hypothetical protein [Thermoguttaceae bacterium]